MNKVPHNIDEFLNTQEYINAVMDSASNEEFARFIWMKAQESYWEYHELNPNNVCAYCEDTKVVCVDDDEFDCPQCKLSMMG